MLGSRSMPSNVGLIGRPDHGPGAGWSPTSAKPPGATVSRHDLDASEDVFPIAVIVPGLADLRMRGRAVPGTAVFRYVSRATACWGGDRLTPTRYANEVSGCMRKAPRTNAHFPALNPVRFRYNG